MLNSSLNPQKLSKLNECVMRRRARNLRAKVKALLPVQTCCKHDNRNRCVHQICDNKKSWRDLNPKNSWTMCQEKQNIYYYQNPIQINHQQRFQKLTQPEIQQIKQDKLYYLGQQNICYFQQFLKEKPRNQPKMNKQTQFILCNTLQNFMTSKTALFFTNVRRNTQLGFQQPKQNQLKQRKRLLKSVDSKIKEFNQRRRQILVQQRSNRIMQKVKLDMKLQRAQLKLRQLNDKKTTLLRLKSQQRNQKLEKVTQRRRNYQNQGQIKLLEQKLRRTFLTRANKTANYANRTVMRQDSQPILSL